MGVEGSEGQFVRSNYRRSGIIPASEQNTVGRMLSRISGDGVEVDVSRYGGIHFRSSGMNWAKVAFGIIWTGNTATVYAGMVHIHGTGKHMACAETSVTLSGSTAYVYVEHNWGGSTAAISATTLAAVPETTADDLLWPLAKFESSDGGTTYTLPDGGRLWFNDIHIATPIR